MGQWKRENGKKKSFQGSFVLPHLTTTAKGLKVETEMTSMQNPIYTSCPFADDQSIPFMSKTNYSVSATFVKLIVIPGVQPGVTPGYKHSHLFQCWVKHHPLVLQANRLKPFLCFFPLFTFATSCSLKKLRLLIFFCGKLVKARPGVVFRNDDSVVEKRAAWTPLKNHPEIKFSGSRQKN